MKSKQPEMSNLYFILIIIITSSSLSWVGLKKSQMEFLKSDLFETEEKSRGKIRRVSSCRLKFTKNCFLAERFSEKCFTFDEVCLEEDQ